MRDAATGLLVPIPHNNAPLLFFERPDAALAAAAARTRHTGHGLRRYYLVPLALSRDEPNRALCSVSENLNLDAAGDPLFRLEWYDDAGVAQMQYIDADQLVWAVVHFQRLAHERFKYERKQGHYEAASDRPYGERQGWCWVVRETVVRDEWK